MIGFDVKPKFPKKVAFLESLKHLLEVLKAKAKEIFMFICLSSSQDFLEILMKWLRWWLKTSNLKIVWSNTSALCVLHSNRWKKYYLCMLR